MPRYRTQAELDAAVRSQMNATQLEKFDQLMATGTWKVNKSITNNNGTVCWLENVSGPSAIIGLDLHGKIQRPLKGKSLYFNKRTLERMY